MSKNRTILKQHRSVFLHLFSSAWHITGAEPTSCPLIGSLQFMYVAQSCYGQQYICVGNIWTDCIDLEMMWYEDVSVRSIGNWPATLPWGGSRGWPLAGIAQTASWAGKSGGSTCSCAPHCPGNRWDNAERCSNTLLMCNRFPSTEAGGEGSPGMCLTDCRPQRKHKRDFFCLFLWYWWQLARTSHVNPVKNA